MMEELPQMWSFVRSYPMQRRFVWPYHLSLLHGNFAFRNAEEWRSARSGSTPLPTWALPGVTERIAHVARTISDRQLKRLLTIRDWRPQMCAGWYVGLTKRTSFVDEIAGHLLASERVFANQ